MSSTDRRIDALLGAVAAAPAIALRVRDEELPQGTVLAKRYRIEECVGRGGMGVVFRALDLSLERPVAIKLIKNRGSQKGLDRFRDEARALAKLSHPNIVEVFDVGDHDGAPYLAMEFVDGSSLRAWQSGRPPSEILDAYAQAGRALSYAHSHDVIHRDIKPDNILIGRDGQVRVVDFGLAAAVAHLDEGTRPGVGEVTDAVGTPAYAAPEQVVGDRSSAQTDQFSLCVSLWEALTGRLPFPTGISRIDAIRRGDIQGRRLADRRIPRRLRRALRRGLAFDPDERLRSMDRLLDVLERPSSRLRPFLSLVPLAILGSALMLAAQPRSTPCARLRAQDWRASGLDTGRLLASLAPARRAEARPRAEALAERLKASRGRWSSELEVACRERPTASVIDCLEHELREHVTATRSIEAKPELLDGNVDDALRKLPPHRQCLAHLGAVGVAADPDDQDVGEQLDAIASDPRPPGHPRRVAAAEAAEAFARRNAGPIGTVRADVALARELASAWQFERAAEVAERAYLHALTSGLDADAGRAVRILANAAREANLPSYPRWRRALERATLDPRVPANVRAECTTTLAAHRMHDGDYTVALELFVQARESLEALGETRAASVAAAGEADALLYRGDISASLERALAIADARERDPLSTNTERADASTLVAAAHVMGGDLELALEHARAAQSVLSDAAGSAQSLDALGMVAYLLVQLGRCEEAITPLDELLEQVEQRMGRNNTRYAKGLELRAIALVCGGEFEGSIADSEAVIVIKETIGDPTLGDSLNNLAATHYDSGNTERALEIVRQAIAAELELQGTESVDAARYRVNLASFLVAAQRPDEALPVIDETLRVYAQTPGLGELEQLEAQCKRAVAQWLAGDLGPARAALAAVAEDDAFADLAPADRGETVLGWVTCTWHEAGSKAARALAVELADRCPEQTDACTQVASIAAGTTQPDLPKGRPRP